jgi:hypothetical protein
MCPSPRRCESRQTLFPDMAIVSLLLVPGSGAASFRKHAALGPTGSAARFRSGFPYGSLCAGLTA